MTYIKRHFYGSFRGRPIVAEVTHLDRGIHVLLTGGEKNCVGAVAVHTESGKSTICLPEGNVQLCAQWCEKIHEKTGLPVTVASGICYNQVAEGETEVLAMTMDILLEQVLDDMDSVPRPMTV